MNAARNPIMQAIETITMRVRSHANWLYLRGKHETKMQGEMKRSNTSSTIATILANTALNSML